MRKILLLFIVAALCVMLFSCAAVRQPQISYAPAKITVYKGKVIVQPTEKFKPMPDTTVDGYIIRKTYR
jgi:hypothetical protein